LQPSSNEAQELKSLTDDYQQIRQQMHLVNQLTVVLEAYYPQALEIAELTTALAREFPQAYPTPEAVVALTPRRWLRWARAHRLSETRTQVSGAPCSNHSCPCQLMSCGPRPGGCRAWWRS
jgi:hypothetical protein